MNAPRRKDAEFHEDKAGPAVPRERASADYERPREDVAEMPEPVTMPTNKARAGVRVPGMPMVLTVGIALAVLAFIVGFLVF